MTAPEPDRVGPVALPVMSEAQTEAWFGLMDVHALLRHGWTLVGGQMVHLHCAARGVSPVRPTDDADTVVDVRADPAMFLTFTQVLLDVGFAPETSGSGHQHRWRRGSAQIDVLLPDGVGERSAWRQGAGGAPTIETPGGTQALMRSASVAVVVDGRVGAVRRPELLGALVMKAAAHTVVGDPGKGRHRIDFVVLAGLVAARDIRDVEITTKDRQRLGQMVGACRVDQRAMAGRDARQVLERLERAVGLA